MVYFLQFSFDCYVLEKIFVAYSYRLNSDINVNLYRLNDKFQVRYHKVLTDWDNFDSQQKDLIFAVNR